MNDYYNFGEILTHTNFLRSDLSFEKDAKEFKITEYFCSNLEFDFEAMKWTDNKTGFEIITLEFIWKGNRPCFY